MRKFLIASFAGLLLLGTDCEAGLLNKHETFVDFVNSLNPSAGTYYSVKDSNWQAYYSGEIYTVSYENLPILSLDAGWSLQERTLLGAFAQLAIIERIPVLKSIPLLGTTKAKIGYVAGYDFADDGFEHGVAFVGFNKKFGSFKELFR